MAKHYDRHLVHCEYLIGLLPLPDEDRLEIHQKIGEIKNAGEEAVSTSCTAVKDALIKHQGILTNNDRELLNAIQTDLILYIQERQFRAYTHGDYQRTSKEKAFPEALRQLLNTQSQKSPFELTTEAISLYEHMVQDGKPGDIFGVASHKVWITEGHDSNGNVTYTVHSKDPEEFIRACMRLNKTKITLNNFHLDYFSNKAEKFAEQVLREANNHLYWIDLQIKLPSEEDEKDKKVSISHMYDQLSEEGQYRLKVNSAIKAAANIEDVYQKTLFIYNNLDKKDARKFLLEQLALHKGEEYQHRLRMAALEKQSTDQKPGYFEHFCKDMHDDKPVPTMDLEGTSVSLERNPIDTLKKGREDSEAYHRSHFGTNPVGHLYQALVNVERLAELLERNSPSEGPVQQQMDQQIEALRVRITQEEVNICQDLDRPRTDIEILENWRKIQSILNDLDGIKSSLNNELNPPVTLTIQQQQPNPDEEEVNLVIRNN